MAIYLPSFTGRLCTGGATGSHVGMGRSAGMDWDWQQQEVKPTAHTTARISVVAFIRIRFLIVWSLRAQLNIFISISQPLNFTLLPILQLFITILLERLCNVCHNPDRYGTTKITQASRKKAHRQRLGKINAQNNHLALQQRYHNSSADGCRLLLRHGMAPER